MSRNCYKISLYALSACTLSTVSIFACAHELTSGEHGELNLDVEALGGYFHSDKNYAQSPNQTAGSSSWQEGFVKYGLSGNLNLLNFGQAYSGFNLLTSVVDGDGDAAGFTDGSEKKTRIGDAYLGWRSGNLFPALGYDGIDLSYGRQSITIGNGFLMAGDALNFGNGMPSGLNRGGGYYIAARRAFDRTAVLRLGGDEGWRSDLMWIESDNHAQQDAEMAVGTLEHVSELGTVGANYIEVLDTSKKWDNPDDLRDDTKTTSLRYEGDGGISDLYLAGEYAWQDRDQGDEDAWYVEAGWSFPDIVWSPDVRYRFSRFSENFDPLFYGNTRDYGTWFQGEVAGNYAGPFNTNTRSQMVSVEAQPMENVTLGAQFFDFDTVKSGVDNINTDGREVSVYGIWGVNKHVALLPLVGLYKPGSSNDTQLDGHGSNLYGQLMMSITF